MSLIQGFVCAVPTSRRAEFIAHARMAAEAFREHGLLGAWECWGDEVPDGEFTSFPRAVQAKPDETVVFSWYLWPSRTAHDAAMAVIMDDPRCSPETNPMPFDGKRVIFGTFEPLLEIGAARPGGYFDGYLLAIRRDQREAFREFAGVCDPVFAESGANWIMEAWEQEVPDGKITDYRKAVQAAADEAVMFSWVQWPDKATRDAGLAKVMADPRLAGLSMPFDGHRMIYGGFVPVVEA